MEKSPLRPENVSESRDNTPRAPLSVEADLVIRINGATAELESTGERLLVQFESVPDTLRAVQSQPRELVSSLTAVLQTTDLTVEIRARNRIVAVAGANARPGLVSRFIGVDPIEVRLSGTVGAVSAEMRDAVAGIFG